MIRYLTFIYGSLQIRDMKLQKQLSRRVGTAEYAKWVVVIPPEKIQEAGWKEGVDLDVTVKDGKITIKTVK